MEFGVPREIRDLEHRVGLTPAGADALIKRGHKVWVEHNAGLRSGFSDEEYSHIGALIAYSPQEVYGRSEIILKVARPTEQEYPLFKRGQTICSFLHLAVASSDLLRSFSDNGITAIAYETMQKADGTLPVLMSTSEVAGKLAPVIASELLTTPHGGRGVLLSSLTGIPPASVVVVGGGVVGLTAVGAFLNIGAQVTVLDKDTERLTQVVARYPAVSTMPALPLHLEKVVQFSDVLVLSVLNTGKRAPVLITRAMVETMKPGSVLIDYSIDQGGASETSRPTSLRDPTYIVAGVIHYCVPNSPALVSRTASIALTNSILPYAMSLGEGGIQGALRSSPEIATGLNFYSGQLVNQNIAASLGMAPQKLIFEE